jgi:AcrR family transcriptional regulator
LAIANQDENLRQRIIDQAAELFFKYGISCTTTQQIAAAMRISKKTLYKYFSTKEKLLSAVFQMTRSQLEQEMIDLHNNQQLDFIEKLKRMMAVIGSYNAKHCPQYCRDIQKYYLQELRTDQVRPPFLEVLTLIEQILKEGIREGMIRNDISIRIIMLLIANILENMFVMDSTIRVEFSLAEIIDALPKLFAEGILTRKAQEKYWS